MRPISLLVPPQSIKRGYAPVLDAGVAMAAAAVLVSCLTSLNTGHVKQPSRLATVHT